MLYRQYIAVVLIDITMILLFSNIKQHALKSHILYMCVLSVSLYAFQPINGYRKLCFLRKIKTSAIAVHQLFNPKGSYRLCIDPSLVLQMDIYRDESVVKVTLFFSDKLPLC